MRIIPQVIQEYLPDHSYLLKDGNGVETKFDCYNQFKIKRMISEYAKEVAIAFVKWANKNHQYFVGATDDTTDAWFKRVSREGVPNMPISNEALFNQFLQETNKSE